MENLKLTHIRYKTTYINIKGQTISSISKFFNRKEQYTILELPLNERVNAVILSMLRGKIRYGKLK